MKTRQGFVSNSSSTSFFFIIKEPTEKCLYDMIRKYKDRFNLSTKWDNTENTSCNHIDVIDELEKVFAKAPRNEWDEPLGFSILSKIGDLEIEIEENKQRSIDSKEPDYARKWWREDIYRAESDIGLLKEASKNGLTWIYNIQFGDNHGDVCGGRIGCTMDYAGQGMEINTPDFVVYTEPNR
jgi:hypothetical protein